MRRRGLTLVEILIAIVVLGIVGAGITRMLQSQLRFFARGANARDARAVSRNALNLMRAELRMAEPNGIVSLSADTVQLRLPYAMGLNCTGSTATFVPVDSLTRATAQFGGYAWRDTTPGASYTYVVGTSAPTVGLASTCTTAGLTPVPDGQVLVLAPALALTTVGAPVLLWQVVTYYFGPSTLVPGRTALWRRAGSATPEEIAVPLDANSAFQFYTTGVTSSTTVPSPLNTTRGLEIMLFGESERTAPGRPGPEQALQRVSIFFRNAVQ